MKKSLFIAVAATTIDGKIAHNSHHFSNWTSKEDKVFLHAILDTCDVVVVGNSTYKMAKKPLSKRNCVVLTRSAKIPKPAPLLQYCNPKKYSLKKIISENQYKKVCVLGGTQIYSYCLENNLLDELYLTIEPITFGYGLPLFETKSQQKWRLISTKKLNKQGSLLLHYKIIKK